MEPVNPRELITAARVADGMVYVVGLAGVVAGAQLYREGDVPFALVAWVLTFIAGAALRLVVWMARGIAQVMDRTRRIEEDVARLVRDDVARREGFGGEGFGGEGSGGEGGTAGPRWGGGWH